MRINVVLHQLDRSGGCRVLLRAADALARAGHEVAVVVPAGRIGHSYPVADRVAIREVGPRLGFGGELTTLGATFLMAASLPPADACLFSYYLCAWPVLAWRARGRARVGVYFVQGNDALVFGAFARKHRAVRRTFAQASLRFSWVFLGNSAYVERLIHEGYGRPCTVIHPGVDAAVFGPGASARTAGEPCVAVVGSDSPTKGWPMVTETLRRLAARIPALRVVAIGERPLAGLEALGGRVTWIAPREDPAMAEALRSASVFFSSSVNEGFGLPVLEAMAVGTPVVATDSLGVRDLLADGVNGALVPYGDATRAAEALLAVLTSAELHSRYREAGLATARQFTWERFETGIGAVFESLARVPA